jgi:hypothetical protein
MADKIIEELWQVKDSIAYECGYDLDSLAAYLRSKKHTESQKVVNLHAIKKLPEQGDALIAIPLQT